MSQVFNVYCDESCYMEHDGLDVFVLGAVWCPAEKAREVSVRLREIKVAHGMAPDFEIKWNKVSPAQARLYADIIDYFFDDDDLHFRTVVAPDKSLLRHPDFNQTHDDWYYKMYYQLLIQLLQPGATYRVYLDVKDTLSAAKVARLSKVLRNSVYDFAREIIERIQAVRSHEVELLQLADLLTGTVSYANRGLSSSTAKSSLVERVRERSGFQLTRSTLLREDKLNVFVWPAAAAVA